MLHNPKAIHNHSDRQCQFNSIQLYVKCLTQDNPGLTTAGDAPRGLLDHCRRLERLLRRRLELGDRLADLEREQVELLRKWAVGVRGRRGNGMGG